MASLPCPKFNTVGFRTALLGLPLTIILSLQQALCWAGARSPVLRRRVALPAALIDIPTVEELDDMYPDLYRTGLAVLAKGENWAAVYNPSGATAHWHKEITEREGLTLMGRAKRTFWRKLHLLGRLDRTVSGITLLAFDAETAEAFESVNKSRTYYALCRNSGEFFFDRGEFAVNRPLKDKRAFGKPCSDTMKESHTDVQVLFGSKDPNCCLVRAKPTTGRYHQIRRHLRNISLPVLGDTYCKKKTRQYFASHGVELPRRVLLHLSSLSVPATAKTPKIHVTCPLPPNFQALIRSSFPSWAAEAEAALPELFMPPPPNLLDLRAQELSRPRKESGLWSRLKDWFRWWPLRRQSSQSLARRF
ncbi:tRNA pseudouridine synthase C (tRNA pseudouridine(65) synthase) (tRNA pseudouridylate synthase C) (tRNA-uridine isomerase C) [Durusdinium trenchii]|uniref:tRNA pseudouridine synthase C (tRNA pseudouridine(65) synthase) (tRNA pseudouridylate synthase C) (tRNA-uridine isomerase C) n=1 Tax=Durusdinium trenchii TaxID=1381693 RepID=A0ABP0IG81_9DINO